MALRRVHYEAAFEDFLRSHGWPYVAVDEKKRAILGETPIKSFDFIVRIPGRKPWLVDVKGRKFPYAGSMSLRYWDNWVTEADLQGLGDWQGVFGEGFEAVLVFAYWLTGFDRPACDPAIHTYGGREYAFLYVEADAYRTEARGRSPSWQTVALPVRTFRQLARPVSADPRSPDVPALPVTRAG